MKKINNNNKPINKNLFFKIANKSLFLCFIDIIIDKNKDFLFI